jgi:hypothetical protein
MLLEIFKTIAVSVSDDSWSYSDSHSGNEDNESTEISFGDPSQHRSYVMFKEGKFTDFTLKFEHHDYPVHKCILFSDSQYFHNYLNKKSSFINITLDWECPQEAIEVFLLSLYTNSVERKTFVKYWWLLCYLAVKYTVKKLKKLCLQEIASFLNQKRLDAKEEIQFFRSLADSDLNAMFAKFIVENYSRLLKEQFPFHSVGKNIILQVFKKLSEKKRSSSLTDFNVGKDEEIEDF